MDSSADPVALRPGSFQPVLQVIASTDRRGAEVFGTELGAVLVARGHDVRTVALAPGSQRPGLAVRCLGSTPMGWRTLLALRNEAQNTGSIVVAHGSSTLAAVSVSTVATRTPFVYRNIGDPTYWASSGARRARVTALLQRASAVTALWPGAADVLIRRHRVARAKIRIIPNGVPLEQFPLLDSDARAEARSLLGLEGQRPVLLYLGALSAEKNVDSAIRAITRLPDARLVVVGDGPQRAALEAMAASTAPGRVRFLGASTEPAKFLAAADVVVLPSSTEGIPASLIEAGLSGIPVVASDVGGVGQVVIDGETGRLVALGDDRAFEAAIQDVLGRKAVLGLAARKHCVLNFDLERVASQWEQLLSQI